MADRIYYSQRVVDFDAYKQVRGYAISGLMEQVEADAAKDGATLYGRWRIEYDPTGMLTVSRKASEPISAPQQR